jgi:hypothetical protein
MPTKGRPPWWSIDVQNDGNGQCEWVETSETMYKSQDEPNISNMADAWPSMGPIQLEMAQHEPNIAHVWPNMAPNIAPNKPHTLQRIPNTTPKCIKMQCWNRLSPKMRRTYPRHGPVKAQNVLFVQFLPSGCINLRHLPAQPGTQMMTWKPGRRARTKGASNSTRKRKKET